jgi:hypothetical protein
VFEPKQFKVQSKQFKVQSNIDNINLHRYWITNSADDAKFAAVFAQLIIRGQRHGVHGFLVRIRDEVREILVVAGRIHDNTVPCVCLSADMECCAAEHAARAECQDRGHGSQDGLQWCRQWQAVV